MSFEESTLVPRRSMAILEEELLPGNASASLLPYHFLLSFYLDDDRFILKVDHCFSGSEVRLTTF